jgi:CMP-N,N'-diacetyllegionaminic acid synthase
MSDGKVLAIIPARAGSKGIPSKNIKSIAGVPLICWTIQQALKSKLLDKVIVSTDGESIAQIAQNAGAEIPFMRPVEFAQDNSPTSDVVIHALKFYEDQGTTYDMVAILEPTSPLRKISDIDRGIETLRSNLSAHTLVSLGEVHTEHPLIVKKMDKDYVIPYMQDAKKIYQRQQADRAYFPYGVIYLARTNYFLQFKTFYSDRTLPLYIERWQNYEVDDTVDFMIIETLIKHYREQIS